MLEYRNFLTAKDKEVRDPVTGYSYPMSVNDIHASVQDAQNNASSRKMIKALLSLTK